MYNNGNTFTELFAILDESGAVVMSRGGSSTTSRLMVYGNRRKAVNALNNRWTKQVHDVDKLHIESIYKAK